MVLKKEKKNFKVLFEKRTTNISFIRSIKAVSFFVTCPPHWYTMTRFTGKFIFWACTGG